MVTVPAVAAPMGSNVMGGLGTLVVAWLVMGVAGSPGAFGGQPAMHVTATVVPVNVTVYVAAFEMAY
jgi:hypothetical protein